MEVPPPRIWSDRKVYTFVFVISGHVFGRVSGRNRFENPSSLAQNWSLSIPVKQWSAKTSSKGFQKTSSEPMMVGGHDLIWGKFVIFMGQI